MEHETPQTQRNSVDSEQEYQAFLDQLALLEQEKERLLLEYKEVLEKRKIEQLRQSIEQGK